MLIRALLALVVVAAVLIPTTATAVAGPAEGQIDIAGAELAGSVGVAAVNVYGTVRCAGAGGNNGLTCPAAGDLVMWSITAGAEGVVVGNKLTITAVAAGSTLATDTEDHVLRWGR
jgi:hypothetical protein